MGHGSRHLWIMLICCLIPAGALAAIFLLGIPASDVVVFGLILLCPLSHVLLMARGGHEHGGAAQAGAQATAAAANPTTTGEKRPACH